MLIIALLNSVKTHFKNAHLRRTFQHLNDDTLKDIGLYRIHGNIYPIAGKCVSTGSIKKKGTKEKPTPQGSDG